MILIAKRGNPKNKEESVRMYCHCEDEAIRSYLLYFYYFKFILGVFCKKSKTKAKHFFTKPRFPLQSFFAKTFPKQKKGFPLQSLTQICVHNNLYFLTLRSYGAPFSTLYFFYKHFVPTEQFLSYEKSTFLFF